MRLSLNSRSAWHGQAPAWPWGEPQIFRVPRSSDGRFLAALFISTFIAFIPACRRADELRTADGKLVSRSQYKENHEGNHIPHGTYEGWYENGRLRITGRYVDGLQHGHWQSWYSSGRPWGSSHYENGELRGTSTLWRPDGTINWQFLYDDGKGDPTYVAFYPSGQKKWQGVGDVVRGQWVGTGQWFDINGVETTAPIGPNGPLAWPGDGDFPQSEIPTTDSTKSEHKPVRTDAIEAQPIVPENAAARSDE